MAEWNEDDGHIIRLRNNATGEVRDIVEPGFSWSDFMWTDGNYSCDCNRSLFWHRAGGAEPDEYECGDGAFTAIDVRFPDGRCEPVDDPT